MSSLNSNHNEAFDLMELNDCVIESSVNISHEDDSESTLSDLENYMNISGEKAIGNFYSSEPENFDKKTCEKYITAEEIKNCETESCRNMSSNNGTSVKMRNKCTHSTENSGKQDMVANQIINTANEDHNYVGTPKKSFKCPVCSIFLQRRLSYAQHIITHIGATPLYCNICCSIFIEDLQLQHHHKLRHTDAALNSTPKQIAFTCNICKLNFSTFCELAEHYLNHIIIMPFVCNLCSLYFSEKLDYLIHQHLHDGYLKCSICSETFCNRREKLKHVLSHQPSKFFRKFPNISLVKQLDSTGKDINGESYNKQSIKPINQSDVNKSSEISKKGIFEMSADESSLLSKLLLNKVSSDTYRNSFTANNSSTEPSHLKDVSQISKSVFNRKASDNVSANNNTIDSSKNRSEISRYNSVQTVNKNPISSNNLSKKAKLIDKFQVHHKIPNSSSKTSNNSNSNPNKKIIKLVRKTNPIKSVTLNNGNESPIKNVMQQNTVLNSSVKNVSKTSNKINKKSSKKKTKISNFESKKKKFNFAKKESLSKKFKLKKCSIFLHKLPFDVRDYHTYQMYNKHLKGSPNSHEETSELYNKYLKKLYTKFNDDVQMKDLIKYISSVKEMHEKTSNLDKELSFALCKMCRIIYSKYSRKNSFFTEISEKNQNNSHMEDIKPSLDLTSSESEVIHTNILIKNRIQKIKKSLACISHIKNPKNLKHEGPSVVLYKLPQYVYYAYSKRKPIMLSNVLPLIEDLQ